MFLCSKLMYNYVIYWLKFFFVGLNINYNVCFDNYES